MECPRLESVLYHLMQVSDPAAAAADASLSYDDGGVRVEIVLAGEAMPTASTGLVVEARAGALLQARVPVSELCDLSNDPEVVVVRATFRGMPNRGTAMP